MEDMLFNTIDFHDLLRCIYCSAFELLLKSIIFKVCEREHILAPPEIIEVCYVTNIISLSLQDHPKNYFSIFLGSQSYR